MHSFLRRHRRRIAPGCAVAAICVLLAVGLQRDERSLPPAPAVHVSAQPPLDLDGLYDLDRLVLAPPARVDLSALPAVGAGRAPGGPPVPEPGLPWILGITVLCALYLQPRSW